MMRRFRSLNWGRLLPLLLIAALAAIILSGCQTDTPQNTFDARGAPADQQRDLFYLAMWPALVIMIGVLGASVVILLRFRRRSDSDPLPKQTHGNTRLELTWTILPAVLLLLIGIPTVAAIQDVGRAPKPEAFHVRAVGAQWLWRFEYPDLGPDVNNPVHTNSELHIPAGREVSVEIVSLDVIHSFWVPKLAGKLDAMPGRTNTMWLRADEPGSFSGQCAEFCGLNHANMRLTVIAQNEQDFNAWKSELTAGTLSGDPDQVSAVNGE